MAISESTNPEERRGGTRIQMQILGSFMTDAIGATACEICDLAPGGVRLSATRQPSQDDRIGLNIPALGRFVGKVAWVDGNEFGVQFTASAGARALANELSTRRSLERMNITLRKDGQAPTLTLSRENGESSEVTLQKLTVEGASFTADTLPEVDETVTICDMPATVMKVVNDRFAVRFHPPREAALD
ncbi:MAG: PilZ domain-containing protein [Maricaulis sp.]|jgi:hypothetical protein|uniref:PilZ domain-containing protein n=1 Tax=Maricaulis sp. TaxID=1486257 RepID=UPI001B2DB6CA|nr:PilZ domain-containing protein [Maricaulis sp.]MBO6848382.1 PilZ domain-containing protein [Maricaulis sp.]MBO6878592.1 PilZ domain-containing protein [Maricaulis sp.]MDM7985457.1 PilZ domain-containing protein [Maricaulis sp.]